MTVKDILLGTSKGVTIVSNTYLTYITRQDDDTPDTQQTPSPAYNHITTDSEENVYVVVNSYIPTQTTNKIANIYKINKAGTCIFKWQFGVSLSLPSFVFSIAVDSAFNLYILGRRGNTVILSKINSAGTLVWNYDLTSTYDNSTTNAELSTIHLAVDSSDNCIIAGTVTGWTYKLIKINTSGTVTLAKSITGFYQFADFKIHKATGKVALSGIYGANNAGYVAVLDSSFNTIFAKTIGDQGAAVSNVAFDSVGNIYFYYASFADYKPKYISLDTTGGLRWCHTLSGTDYSKSGVNVDLATDNVFFESNNRLIVFDSNGTRLFSRYGGLFYGGQLAIDSECFIVFTGAGDAPVARLPKDGSKTGTYTVDGTSVNYFDAGLTPISGTVPIASFTPTVTTITPTFTNNGVYNYYTISDYSNTVKLII